MLPGSHPEAEGLLAGRRRTLLENRDNRSAPPARGLPHRSILLAMALLFSCAKGATRQDAPITELHYPAWLGVLGDQLLVVNLNQDLLYDNGSLVAVASGGNGQVLGGVSVPSMAGQLLVVDDAAAGAGTSNDCTSAAGFPFAGVGEYKTPFALVAGRFENNLTIAQLNQAPTPEQPPITAAQRLNLEPFSASYPFGVGFTCSPGAVPRLWVGYQSGMDDVGYLDQIDLTRPPGDPGSIVEVSLGKSPPRSFAYDATHDRIYFTTREVNESAPLRWIDIGAGCKSFPGGVQDERQGGCHVDTGFDLSLQFRGAEPNVIRLDPNAVRQCTVPGFTDRVCRRAYLSVRMYDADLALALGGRPSTDIGGKLVVLELPEGGQGQPLPQVVAEFDIGVTAGDVEVIPRGSPTSPIATRPIVAVTAVDDELVWIYDDEVGGMVKVFGRGANGVPVLGDFPSALASIPSQDGTTARLFVSAYQDDWVSAVDVPLASPAGAYVVREGSVPDDTTQPVRHWGVPQ